MAETTSMLPGQIGTALGAGQAVLGAVQTLVGGIKANALRKRLQPFKTPDEIYDILKAAQNNAQFGFDPATLTYLTDQTDRAFSATAGIAKRLGADQNVLSNLFDQKIQATMKIGADNHALNMDNFSKYLGALETVAANKAAEQKSKQDLLKDQIQAAVGNKQAGLQNIFNGLSAGLGALSADDLATLFKAAGSKNPIGSTGVSTGIDKDELIRRLVSNSSIKF